MEGGFPKTFAMRMKGQQFLANGDPCAQDHGIVGREHGAVIE